MFIFSKLVLKSTGVDCFFFFKKADGLFVFKAKLGAIYGLVFKGYKYLFWNFIHKGV